MKHTYLPSITLQRGVINNTDSLLLYFSFNTELLTIIRRLKPFSWHTTHRCWYGKFSQQNLKLVKQHMGNVTALIEDASLYKTPNLKSIKRKLNLTPKKQTILYAFHKYLEGKRYSKSTIETYSVFVGDFLIYIKDKSLQSVSNRDVELFIEDVFIPRNYSISTHRQFISALKLFKQFYPTCGIEELTLTRPKKSRYLPVVLSQEEVLTLLQCTKNLKHRAALALLYSCGLRVGELINLELKDIDLQRNQVAIKNSKGRKDRYVQMADSLVPLLLNYIRTYSPERFFVEGLAAKKYSASSIRAFLKRSCEAANITKKVTPHTLRHSYATHLLEGGTNLRLIQTLLGHSKPETTMIYTHVSTHILGRIHNPLDQAVKKFMTPLSKENSLRLENDTDKL